MAYSYCLSAKESSDHRDSAKQCRKNHTNEKTQQRKKRDPYYIGQAHTMYSSVCQVFHKSHMHHIHPQGIRRHFSNHAACFLVHRKRFSFFDGIQKQCRCDNKCKNTVTIIENGRDTVTPDQQCPSDYIADYRRYT